MARADCGLRRAGLARGVVAPVTAFAALACRGLFLTEEAGQIPWCRRFHRGGSRSAACLARCARPVPVPLLPQGTSTAGVRATEPEAATTRRER